MNNNSNNWLEAVADQVADGIMERKPCHEIAKKAIAEIKATKNSRKDIEHDK